ncbi:MAG: hypothetical protein H8E46_05540 [FCB group bacterium]|nr:hypothetical protein [FCB group bacterium]
MKCPGVLLALLLTIIWLGCSDTPTESFPDDVFIYTSYDTSGIPAVSGWFTMTFSDSGAISGDWHFSPVGNPQNIGPQTGEGNLIGGIDENNVWIELNPQYIDHNLRLTGTLEGDRYTGEWQWISYVGVTNQGNFEAIRQ